MTWKLTWVLIAAASLGITNCQRGQKSASAPPRSQIAPASESTEEAKIREIEQANIERKEQQEKGPFVSEETKKIVEKVVAGEISVKGHARLAVLYFKDQPAHRALLLDWFQNNNGVIAYENQRFGYFDATLPWEKLHDLIKAAGQIGLSNPSIFKLELYDIEGIRKAQDKPELPSPVEEINSSLFGSVHSAGYGIKLDEFRKQVAADLQKTESEIEGQGTLVAIYDSGLDLSRKDVFGERIKDFYLGSDTDWRSATMTLAELQTREGFQGLPNGLADLEGNTTLRFISLEEKPYRYDLNGSGVVGESLLAAVFEVNDEVGLRVRPLKGMAFGETLQDFAKATAAGLPSTVNLYTGALVRDVVTPPPPSVAGIKIRGKGEQRQIAFVGLAAGAEHGTANLHMVGGDFYDEKRKVRYRGVAPKTNFVMMQSWTVGNVFDDYGSRWVPLARTIIDAAEAQADVIDLDIYTPGTRNAQDLLSSLLCRVTAATNSVPVIAAHNYGPLYNTVQSLAQSPCVLGIGAAHSVAALYESRLSGSVNPNLREVPRDQLLTASYSGRGLALNGLMKPDIIAPAYAYTAYGAKFTRFGGTSGATPTTAGAIALLKQAARFYGVELGFEQIRFLLQGSSGSLSSDKVLDGYGNLNLFAAWQNFKKLYTEAGAAKPSRFSLGGHKLFQFEGRPNQSNLKIDLSRNSVWGSVNSPEPMRVWIELAGATPPEGRSWLKLYDKYNDRMVTEIDFDAPMHGEAVPLRFAIDFTDDQWAHLAPGYHVATIKAVRSLLKAERYVDFAMPVMIVKGHELGEGKINVPKLYADETFTLAISAEPGQTLMLYPSISCEGTPITIGNGSNGDSLLFLADSSNYTAHASEVMNSYAPIYLSPQPLKLTAERSVINLGLMRYRQWNCLGGISAQFSVRRLGFAVKDTKSELTTAGENNEQFALKYRGELKLQTAGLNAADIIRGVTWKAGVDKTFIRLSAKTDSGLSFKVPKGSVYVRAVPKDAKKFQAVLTEQNAEGKIINAANTDASYHSGFASAHTATKGAWYGLELTKLTEGSLVTLKPLANSGFEETVVEVLIAAGDKIRINSSSPSLTTLLQGETVTLDAEFGGAKSLANYAEGFDGKQWTVALGFDVAVKEETTNIDPGVEVAPLTLWSSRLFFPLLF